MFGFKLKTANSRIVVDSGYKNFSVHKSGTAVPYTHSDGYRAIDFPDIAKSSSATLVAVAPGESEWVAPAPGYPLSTAFVPSGSTYSFPYIIIHQDRTSVTGKYGIFVSGPDGGRGFDSRERYVRVVDFLVSPLPGNAGNVGALILTHTPISEAYYLINPIYSYQIYQSGRYCAIAQMAVRQNSNSSVEVSYRQVAYGLPASLSGIKNGAPEVRLIVCEPTY